MDKIDPPAIPEGYGLSVAFLCMLDVVKCVQSLIEGAQPVTESKNKDKATNGRGDGMAQATAKSGAEFPRTGIKCLQSHVTTHVLCYVPMLVWYLLNADFLFYRKAFLWGVG